MAGAMVWALADHSDAGADHVLSQCRSGLTYGLENGSLTQYQANLGRTILQLADRRVPSMRLLNGLATRWIDDHRLIDACDAVVAAAELIAMLASPPFGRGLASIDYTTTQCMAWLSRQDDNKEKEQ